MRDSLLYKTLKENLLARVLDILMLVAGFTIALQFNTLNLSTWAIAVYPSILIAKSVMGNLLNGYVITALHLGTAYSRLTGNTRAFYDLLRSLIFQTFIFGFVISVFAMFFGSILWGVSLLDFPELLTVVLATLGLGLLIYPITGKIVFMAFSKGINLERVIHPLTGVFSGIIITGLYVFVLNLPVRFGMVGRYAIDSIAFLFLIVTVLSLLPRVSNKNFRQIVKEPLFALIVAAFVSIITGTVFKRISSFVLMRAELYATYPALIFIGANVGLAVGSTATTKLALGLLRPRLRAIRSHTGQILACWIASLIAFAILSGLSLAAYGVFMLDSLTRLVATLFIANVVAVVAIVLVGYAFAVLVFQRRLELDSLAVPIESAFAALMITVGLLIALMVLQFV